MKSWLIKNHETLFTIALGAIPLVMIAALFRFDIIARITPSVRKGRDDPQ
ncbi:MAG: hypothetical protein L0220_02795 [Acidobacteria bacterium]|nr:hypothetical protein [Acidobacteriota bacterium]